MKSKTLELSLTILFASLTAIGSYLYIPLFITPIPMTLQTLFVYLSGAILGSRMGFFCQLLYLLVGIVGLPIFAGGRSGFSVIIGPTGGYLIGFPLGSFVIGKLLESKENADYRWMLVSMLIGTVTIYSVGVIQLMNILRTSLQEAVLFGIIPFIGGDVLKSILGAYVAMRVKRTWIYID